MKYCPFKMIDGGSSRFIEELGDCGLVGEGLAVKISLPLSFSSCPQARNFTALKTVGWATPCMAAATGCCVPTKNKRPSVKCIGVCEGQRKQLQCGSIGRKSFVVSFVS